MGQRPLTALGQQFMAGLPPFLRSSPDYEAVQHSLAVELERLAATVETVRAQFNPATADVLLSAWERETRLPVGGAGASLDQRQAAVIARLKKMTGASEGREWEEQVTEVVGPGWTYQEHDPADPTSPAPYVVRIVLPFPPTGTRYIEAEREIQEFTPAHISIEFSSTAGFILDVSDMDVETMPQ